eukprot:2906563-Rhodomonas_salina.3
MSSDFDYVDSLYADAPASVGKGKPQQAALQNRAGCSSNELRSGSASVSVFGDENLSDDGDQIVSGAQTVVQAAPPHPKAVVPPPHPRDPAPRTYLAFRDVQNKVVLIPARIRSRFAGRGDNGNRAMSS